MKTARCFALAKHHSARVRYHATQWLSHTLCKMRGPQSHATLASKILLCVLGVQTTPVLAEREIKSFNSTEVTYVTHIMAPYKSGSRLHYEADLLRLMLEKTRLSHGDYVMSATPDVNTTLRDLRMLKNNRKANFVRAFALDKTLLDDRDLIYIDFPILRGSLSYRICFTAKKNIARFKSIHHFDEIVKLSMVQGLGWPDRKILEHAGFQVFEAGAKRAIFEMTARGRADLFCRGIAEYKSEWERYKNELPDLSIEENFLIFYPFPRYFFAHRSDKKLLDRLEAGLKKARDDGSFIRLWERYHADAISYAMLDKRKVFILENPSLSNMDLDYDLYFYPLKAAVSLPLTEQLTQPKPLPEAKHDLH